MGSLRFVNSGFIFVLLVGDVYLNLIIVRSRFCDVYTTSGNVFDDSGNHLLGLSIRELRSRLIQTNVDS